MPVRRYKEGFERLGIVAFVVIAVVFGFIRFDRANVPYQQALYSAIGRVLERRPNAVFDLVAVAPSAGGPARVALNTNKSRRFADGVLRSLMDMGLPPSRVAVSGKTSPAARTNEVHLYLR